MTTLLTESQVAEILGISVRTVQGWRHRGGGPRYLKLGKGHGAVRYDLSDLQDYIASRARASTSDKGPEAG